MGPTSCFLSLLGNFLNFVLGMLTKEMSYPSIWFQQMVGPGCSPQAAPVPGKCVRAHVSIISPQQTGPPGVLRMRWHSPPSMPFHLTSAPSPHLSPVPSLASPEENG